MLQNIPIDTGEPPFYFLRLIALLQLQVLPWPWSGSGHLYWFFHYDDALESPFCGFDFIVCTNVGSNRWNLNFQILMKLFSKVCCELNYNYKIFSSSSSSYFLNTLWTKITITITIQVLPRPWSGSGHLYWFFHCDDTL